MSAMSARSSRTNTELSQPGGLRMLTMRPCAMGLRRKATSRWPGSIVSATKLPRPRRWRASSLRLTRAPMPCALTRPRASDRYRCADMMSLRSATRGQLL